VIPASLSLPHKGGGDAAGPLQRAAQPAE
jgi:hypothetical protein